MGAAGMGAGADLGSGLGTGIGGFIGYENTAENRAAAQQDYQDALNAFLKLHPEQAKAIMQGQSDPNLVAQQSDALNKLKSVYSAGGLDPQAKADIANANNAANQQATAQRAQVQNEMEQRGMGASGSNYAAKLAGGATAANTANLADINAAGQGAQQALDATGQAGQLATTMRGQSDAINQFNAQNQTGTNQFNAGQGNTIALGQAQGEAGAYGNMAKDQKDQAEQEEKADSGIGGALGSVAGAVGGFFGL